MRSNIQDPEPPKIPQRLLPEQRVRKTWAFKFIFDRGFFVKGKVLNFWIYSDNDQKFETNLPCLGVIVSKKVHLKANVRNLWKRRIRESFRRQCAVFKEKTVILVQAKAGKRVPASLGEINEDFESAAKKAQVFR